MEVDKYQRKYVFTIEQFVNMHIHVPKIQRSADDDRISDIIEYQVNHYEKYGTFCFLGDITVYNTSHSPQAVSQSNDQIQNQNNKIHSDSWFIIDGMHRYLAMKSPKIYELHPTYKVSVNVIHGSNGFTMEDAFLLINKARPVPHYVIETTMEDSKRSIIEELKRIIQKEYKSYLTKAEHPRIPNFNLDVFLSCLLKSPMLHLLSTLDLLIGYIKYANMCLASDECCSSKIKASISAKCEKQNLNTRVYFSADPYFSWMFNTDWISHYLKEKERRVFETKTSDNKENKETETRKEKDKEIGNGQRKRKKRATIPKVIRAKLWDMYYGKEMESVCKCCRMNKVTYLDFDAGHIVSHKDGGSDSINNLVPICRPCNLGMGAENMNDFAKKINPNVENISEWKINIQNIENNENKNKEKMDIDI